MAVTIEDVDEGQEMAKALVIADAILEEMEARGLGRHGVWNDKMIRSWQSAGGCLPTLHTKINPNSVDLSLSPFYQRPRYWWRNPFLRHLIWPFLSSEQRDMRRKENASLYWSEPIPFDDLTIWPGEFLLFSTYESTRIPDNICPFLFSKSTTGRMGLEHLHAGLGDAGFNGCWTLELKNMGPFPIVLKPKERYFQIVLIEMVAPADKPYAGRYQGQTIYPQPAKEEQI